MALAAGCSTRAEISTAAPVSQPTVRQVTRAALPDLGAAPELTNEVWLNTAAPLRLDGLRGKVVLIDMWTFG